MIIEIKGSSPKSKDFRKYCDDGLACMLGVILDKYNQYYTKYGEI